MIEIIEQEYLIPVFRLEGIKDAIANQQKATRKKVASFMSQGKIRCFKKYNIKKRVDNTKKSTRYFCKIYKRKIT